MKNYVFFISAALALASCMKKVDSIVVDNNFSSVAVINAAPSAVAGTTNGNLFVDNVLQSGSPVPLRGSSGYLSVRPGTRDLRFVASSFDSATFVNLPSQNFEAGKAYTYVIYDTVAAAQTGAARRLRSIRLNDNLSLEGKQANGIFLRVLHLAPLAPAIDVTFLRNNVTPNDSVTVSNLTFVGLNPNDAQLSTLSNFNTTLPAGFSGFYNIRVKLAGTQTVVATATANLTTQAVSQSFVTVFVTGGAQRQPVSIGVFRHYP